MLEKFLVSSDSAFLETIDLKLLLMAMPTHISASKIKRTVLFHFPTLQDSLLAFINSTPSEAFRHYDKGNIKRVHRVRESILEQKRNLDFVQRNITQIQACVRNNEAVLSNFHEMKE